jgi:hypothetical protein
MVDGTVFRWWQCLEGRLLIAQLLLFVAFATWCSSIYYTAFYSYVPSVAEPWRCATGESIVFLFALLASGYLLALSLWQLGLVRRRRHKKAASAWSILSFAAALLPAVLLIYVWIS